MEYDLRIGHNLEKINRKFDFKSSVEGPRLKADLIAIISHEMKSHIIKRRAVGGAQKPNKPSTIERKGSDVPLLETGKLLKSIGNVKSRSVNTEFLSSSEANTISVGVTGRRRTILYKLIKNYGFKPFGFLGNDAVKKIEDRVSSVFEEWLKRRA